MMTCHKTVEELLEYIEGAMTAADQDDLQKHLKACPACLRLLENYRKTTDLCRWALCGRAPQELATKVMSFLRTAVGKHPRETQ